MTDGAGQTAALDRVAFAGPLAFSGELRPASGSREGAVLVAGAGPLTGWALDVAGPPGAPPALTFTSAGAPPGVTFAAARPAPAYRREHAHLADVCEVAAEVVRALDPARGGSPDATWDDVVARLARGKAGKAFGLPSAALAACGGAVLAALAAVDAAAAPSVPRLLATPLAIKVAEALAAFRRGGAAGMGGISLDAAAPADPTHPRVETVAPPAPAADAKGKGKAAAGAATATAGPTRTVVLPSLAPAAAAALADADFALQSAVKEAEAAAAKKGGAGGGGGGGGGAGSGAAYIKIDPSEIADDYPEPALFDKQHDETDELVLFFEEAALHADPASLPRRALADFAVYNADGFLASLELLPMWGGVEPDTPLFASGLVSDPLEDECAGAIPTDKEGVAAAAAAGGSAAVGGSSGGGASAEDEAGVRTALSQIQEWVLEAGPGALYINIRTEAGWYRLLAPAAAYAGLYAPVVKAARLAIAVLTLLSGEDRPSRLSFDAVVARLAALPVDHPAHVSSKAGEVDRFLTVHAQILLNQAKVWPERAVRECAFVGALRDRLATRRHAKLYALSTKAAAAARRKRGVRSNPTAMRDKAAKDRKPMTATATAMVEGVWQTYFADLQKAAAAAAAAKRAEAGASEDAPKPVADDCNAEEGEEGEEEEDGLVERDEAADAAAAAAARGSAAAAALAAAAGAGKAAALVGPALPKSAGGPAAPASATAFYKAATAATGAAFRLGDVVELAPSAEGGDAPLGLVQALWATGAGAAGKGKKGSSSSSSASAFLQVRPLVRAADTVLGDAGNEAELFLAGSLQPVTRPLGEVVAKVAAAPRARAWATDAASRAAAASEDAALRAANDAAAEAGAPRSFFYKSVYEPERGLFRSLPSDLGSSLGSVLATKAPARGIAAAGAGAFTKDGVRFAVGDAAFVGSTVFDQCPAAVVEVSMPSYVKGRFAKGGANTGLRAYGLGRITAVHTPPGSSTPHRVTVERFYRPEDISPDAAYAAGWWDVWASAGPETVEVDIAGDLVATRVAFVAGPGAKAAAGERSLEPAGADPAGLQARVPTYTYAVVGTFNRKTGKFASATPPGLPSSADEATLGTRLAHPGGPGAAPAPAPPGLALRTMDIFAGCGGLSEGLHQAGAAVAEWAIEYEAPAADAFRLNNPAATTWCANCNVILAAAMAKAGQAAHCRQSEECAAEVGAMDAATLASLPAPGEVEFLCGGPPCQGYSGMNRFNKGNWSMVQNSMVMAYLSFADFYRPRYFLLENVRNFVSHNKSLTFRLALRSLLEMGYQVRFGVLNAGNFGVAQSRKRTFIWAAAPDEALPEWPAPRHVFKSPQLTINLPGGVAYTAVPQRPGAPCRTVTVRDAIGDLPPIANGEARAEVPYTAAPASAFQAAVRGSNPALLDHISKEMNELNLERCRCIPKDTPGADWRVLQQIVAADPGRAKFKGADLVPWCLPNTADRHNGWRGLFGRLDMAGHFPTSTTDPQPMGKVGQVFHPSQDRIVSVRECARAQGFPDGFRLSGNVHQKHRQVGNAVPVPLAAALGCKLRQALEATAAAKANK